MGFLLQKKYLQNVILDYEREAEVNESVSLYMCNSLENYDKEVVASHAERLFLGGTNNAGEFENKGFAG